MSATDWLWEQVRECFDTDDGSLPGIEIAGLSPEGVASVYAMLRGRSRLASDSAEFEIRPQEACLPVDSLPHAAALVAAGEAEPFHLCIAGVVAAGVELPVLGVFVLPDAVELDYRMGPDWGPPQVAGFFELLRDCCALDPHARVRSASDGPLEAVRLEAAWARYRGQRPPPVSGS